MNLLPVLLLTLTTTTLVLRSGDRITVDDTVNEANGVVTFRVQGTLYSMSAQEVERIERAETAEPPPVVVRGASSAERPRLRASEEERRRLLEELAKNHAGTPAPPLEKIREQSPAEKAQQSREEWSWRREARSYEENIRRAAEELALLESRAAELQAKIISLVSQGYKPGQFTYDTTQLARTQEQIPYARLELTRAERAYEQFREDARRQGVLPGWLR